MCWVGCAAIIQWEGPCGACFCLYMLRTWAAVTTVVRMLEVLPAPCIVSLLMSVGVFPRHLPQAFLDSVAAGVIVSMEAVAAVPNTLMALCLNSGALCSTWPAALQARMRMHCGMFARKQECWIRCRGSALCAATQRPQQ